MVAIELKDDEGEQHADQIKFETQWKAAGGVYYVARTVEAFQHIVNAYARPAPIGVLPWVA
jgi:hypothetical protein